MSGASSEPVPENSAVVFPKPPTPTMNSPPLPPSIPLTDPPPPYPSRDRRSRAGTTRSSRRIAQLSNGMTVSTMGQGADGDISSPTDDGSETTPLLSPRRPRTLSHSTVISTNSIAHTVFSLFQTEAEQDTVPNLVDYSSHATDDVSWSRRIRRYFRPMWKAAYYQPLLHLLVINFPYALVAFVYLFVGTLTGTTLLIALPLGAVICWFNLIGARAFARGELAMQARFHGPLAIQPLNPPNPIFSRRVEVMSPRVMETGEAGRRVETSFLRNTYSMFTDPTSYQAIFYFLVIKPSITLFLSIALVLTVPVAFVLILPAPAILRAVKRIGIWQANIAMEGLSRPRL